MAYSISIVQKRIDLTVKELYDLYNPKKLTDDWSSYHKRLNCW